MVPHYSIPVSFCLACCVRMVAVGVDGLFREAAIQVIDKDHQPPAPSANPRSDQGMQVRLKLIESANVVKRSACGATIAL